MEFDCENCGICSYWKKKSVASGSWHVNKNTWISNRTNQFDKMLVEQQEQSATRLVDWLRCFSIACASILCVRMCVCARAKATKKNNEKKFDNELYKMIARRVSERRERENKKNANYCACNQMLSEKCKLQARWNKAVNCMALSVLNLDNTTSAHHTQYDKDVKCLNWWLTRHTQIQQMCTFRRRRRAAP